MKNIWTYLLPFLSIFILSCGGVSQAEYDALIAENDSLRNIKAQMEYEINSYQNLPDKLTNDANSEFRTRVDNGNNTTITACNIFYRGIQNPLSVKASGYDNFNVTVSGGASITKGKLAGYDGDYIVTIPAENQTKEVVVGINVDGKSIGQQTFKVINVPTPTICIGGYKNGSDLPKSVIKSSPRLDAVLDDGFLPFNNVKYTVTSFTYLKDVRGVTTSQVVSGNTIPGDILSDISKKASGASVAFVGINISTPSGQTQTLGYVARLK